jgi:hypothetical protein
MSSNEEAEVAARLLAFERQLMDPVFRKDRAAVSSLLAKDFREFGASGREWSREAILDLLETEPSQPAPQVEDFRIQPLTADAVLVTYRTIRPAIQANRSSIWIQNASGWQVLFHQGTKVPEA